MKFIVAILISMMLLFGSVQVSSAKSKMLNEPSDVGITVDVLLLRPLGFTGFALGTSLFLVSLPLTVITGSVGTTKDKLVDYPAYYTFRRPVGHLDMP